MSPQELADAYLDALSRADVGRMLDLFSDDALVRSPLYGPVPASMFFPADPADRLRHR
jgi:ketosteroid isomerase-like protein